MQDYKITEAEKLNAKKWAKSLSEEELDELYEAKRNWEQEKKPTYYDDVKHFADVLAETTDDKLIELERIEKWLSGILKNKTHIRKSKFLREYKGKNPQQDWEYVFHLTDINLKKRLSNIRTQIDQFKKIKKIVEPKAKEYEPINIEAIKEIPITDFYLNKVKKTGGKLVGLCPFHNEKTPSFTIYEKTNSYHCFGCGASGTVIDYYMHLKSIDTKTAIRELNSYITR